MAHLVCPLNEEIFALPIPIGIGHIRHQPKGLLPCYKMVYPLKRRDVLGLIAPKKLIQGKLMVPTTHMPP